MNNKHMSAEPSILNFGTPVVLISTFNEDSNANIAPMSSAFWFGWRCLLGLGSSKTAENMIRTGECVLNLPSIDESAVNRLTCLTRINPIPADNQPKGYRYDPNKFERTGLTSFERADLTPVASETVATPRAMECPVQMEAVVVARHGLVDGAPKKGAITLFEVRIQRVHALPEILMNRFPNWSDPVKWRP